MNYESISKRVTHYTLFQIPRNNVHKSQQTRSCYKDNQEQNNASFKKKYENIQNGEKKGRKKMNS